MKKRYIPIIILIAWMPMLIAAWDKDKPAATLSLRSSNPQILANNAAIEAALDYEHVFGTGGTQTGVHENGSAVAYEGTSTPTNRPDGSTALANNAYDRGRMWIDDNYDPPVIRRWTGTAFEVLGRYIAGAGSQTLTFLNTTAGDGEGARISQIRARGTQSGSEESMLGHITFFHDGTGDDEKGKFRISLNDGDDGESPSLTVLAIGSDQLVELPGALTVTGAGIFTAGITANGGVTLGAGDDLIGSSTSDITMNTDKFTVAGATGNTVIGGTLDVAGATSIYGTRTTDDSASNAFDEDNVYKAGSDGYVSFQAQCSTAFNTTIYSDSGSSPSTQLVTAYQIGGQFVSGCERVKKDEYWQITLSQTKQNLTIYWLPIGTGTCVKQ